MEATPSIILSLKGITKSFGQVRVLHGIDLEIKEGSTMGLVGENGAGKSTILNILGGNLQPESGALQVGGQPYQPQTPVDAEQAGIAFIHQELNLFENLSIAENFYLTDFPERGMGPIRWIDRKAMRAETEKYLKRVGLAHSPGTRVSALSPGEKQLVEIAKALSRQAKVILFDEPTTSLTHHEVERLFALIRELQQAGQTLVFISHDLQDVLDLCDEIAVLRDGHLVRCDLASEWTVNGLIKGMVGRSIDQLFPVRQTPKFGESVVEVNHLKSPGRLQDVSVSIREGEILGLFGLIGAGRTELARAIFGLDSKRTGDVRIQGVSMDRLDPREAIRNGAAFVTENRKEDGLLLTSPVFTNFTLANLKSYLKGPAGWIAAGERLEAARRLGKTVDLDRSVTPGQWVNTLSGGNQQKVVLGRWLDCQPKFLILDEPTRGVDVGAKENIYRLIHELAENGSAILLISSEIEELIGISDRVLVMRDGSMAGSFTEKPFDRELILKTALDD